MANFNLTITDEGAAFLANIIATQGSVDFTEMRFSTTNYVGQEATLTEGSWAGTFITAAPSASVVDSTTINVAASFDNTTLTTPKDLYSIGLIGYDGNDTALVAVATTSDPAKISEFILNPSYYAYNFNLGVSSTSGITVTGSMAGALFVSDIVDNLTSSNTNKPLSAKQGKVLEDGKADKVTSATSGDFAGLDSSGNLTDSGKKAADFATDDEMSAVVNVYGAKNLLQNTAVSDTINGVTFTINADRTVTTSGTASADTVFSLNTSANYYNPKSFYPYYGGNILNGCTGGSDSTYFLYIDYSEDGIAWGGHAVAADGDAVIESNHAYYSQCGIYVKSGTNMNGKTFKPMIRDSRITDPTYVPYAKTNRELTVDKAECNDITSIRCTGATNTTGSTIYKGTLFYLNNQLCYAKSDIAANASFTLDTNYGLTTMGDNFIRLHRGSGFLNLVDTTLSLRNGILTIDAKDSTNSGIAIDFAYDSGWIRVYKTENGTVTGYKTGTIV